MISVAEYRALLKKRQHKYGAKAVQIEGVRFDSSAEAARYSELQLLERGGQIAGLVIHPVFVLQPAFRDVGGRRIAAIRYVADFVYQEGAQTVVEDVKGAPETPVFKLKAKLFRFLHPEIELRVVRMGGR